MILYRADGSTLAELKRRGGFVARAPLGTLQARAHLHSFTVGGRSPLDLSRLIIGSPQPQYVSTDPDPGCGGYASTRGSVYKIEVTSLERRPWASALGRTDLRPIALWPSLYLNAPTLATATAIAVKHFGAMNEVTFLTIIPYRSILEVKPKGSTSFSRIDWARVS